MKNKSLLVRKLLQQYILWIVLLVAAIVIIPLVGRELSYMKVWYPEDPMYQVLSWLKGRIWFVMLFTAFFGWIVVTYIYFRRLSGYLNEAFSAAEKMIAEPDKRIELSPDLQTFEIEMNRIREDNLFHQRAAKEAEQRKNELIVYLAHDLRTPLTSVIGYLTLLDESPELPMEARAKYIGITLNKAYRLESLINDFFEITRFNLSTISLTKQATNLGLMVEQISFEFLPILDSKQLSWELDIAKDIEVAIDTEKFERILDNLIRNAIAYADAQTVIKVSLEKNGNQARLIFENSSPTIPAEKLARIFEPFYRASSSRDTESGGTGLGLPIAKELVELHGGILIAESEEQRFRMILTLPISESSNAANE